MKPIMVMGCTSDAGKSLATTALCRWFADQGVSVAPFKAQNMSNNARVVDGGEIGVAQWLQARAARIEPTVDMNPVLLKPEADTRSQVIVCGQARPDITDTPWRERAPLLWPEMTAAYDRLAAKHDLIIIEGAGSPAEINLTDLVNNRMIEYADAAGILVVDIDRGGAFAHLVGTHELVPQSTKDRLAGFVLNKFRGDASLLSPAPERVTELTGMAHLGVVPMTSHQLPDEEGGTVRANPPAGAPSAAIVRYPYASNLDEWHLLARAARVRWASAPADLDGADIIVLPGSKHLRADAEWLRTTGLFDAVAAAAAAGTKIIGVCGGTMMLAHRIIDEHGVEGEPGHTIDGFGLIDAEVTMSEHKLTQATTVTLSNLAAPWQALNGVSANGYEIRHGQIRSISNTRDAQASPGEISTGNGTTVWSNTNVLATTVHGLFESPNVLHALTGQEVEEALDPTFTHLANHMASNLDIASIVSLTHH